MKFITCKIQNKETSKGECTNIRNEFFKKCTAQRHLKIAARILRGTNKHLTGFNCTLEYVTCLFGKSENDSQTVDRKSAPTCKKRYLTCTNAL